MTRDEAVTQVQAILRFHTGLSSRIITALQHSQQILEKGPTLPWFLRSERSHIDCEADEERIVLPNDFLREAEDSALWYVPTDTTEDEVELKKDDVDYLRNRYPRTTTGIPTHYSLDKSYFRLFPTPDAIYRFRTIYYKKDDVLDSNIENLWLEHHPYLLIGEAGKIVAASTRDERAYKEFAELAGVHRLILDNDNTAREFANRRLQMGDGV